MKSGDIIVKRGESSRSAGSPSHDATRQNSDGPSVHDDEVDEVVSGSEGEEESGTDLEDPEEEDCRSSQHMSVAWTGADETRRGFAAEAYTGKSASTLISWYTARTQCRCFIFQSRRPTQTTGGTQETKATPDSV
jgi:hypothetical protein